MLIKASAFFKIVPSKFGFKNKVKLRPTEHRYIGNNGKTYVEYSCQICQQLAETIIKLPLEDGGSDCSIPMFPKGTKRCPCCGVNIDWNYKSDLVSFESGEE